MRCCARIGRADDIPMRGAVRSRWRGIASSGSVQSDARQNHHQNRDSVPSAWEARSSTFTFNPAPGFSPTILVCPSTHKAGCTIKGGSLSQIWEASQNNSADIDVDVTGPGQAVQPHNFVGVDSTTDGPLANVHTFQWLKTGIPAGSTQTVNIFVAIDTQEGS